MDCQTARPDTLILPLYSKTDVFFKSPEWEELTISPMLPELYRHNIIPMKKHAENHFVDHMLFRKLKDKLKIAICILWKLYASWSDIFADFNQKQVDWLIKQEWKVCRKWIKFWKSC